MSIYQKFTQQLDPDINYHDFQWSNETTDVIDKRKIDAKNYRQNVAIPRYLEKRKKRKWEKKLMYPSRKLAADNKIRNFGKFSIS